MAVRRVSQGTHRDGEMIAIVVLYLIAGVMFVKNWPRFAESGKTFLWLVFPVHTIVYLVFADFGSQQIREGVRAIAVILVLLYLLAWLAR